MAKKKELRVDYAFRVFQKSLKKAYKAQDNKEGQAEEAKEDAILAVISELENAGNAIKRLSQVVYELQKMKRLL